MSNKQKKDIAPVDTPETPTEDIAPVDTPADWSEGTDIWAESNDNAPTEDIEVLESDEQPPLPTSWVDGVRPEWQYNCLVNIKHNGKLYSVWEKIELTENEAGILLSDKSIF